MYISPVLEEIREDYYEEVVDILNLDIEWGLLPIEYIDKPLDELEPEILNELLGGR